MFLTRLARIQSPVSGIPIRLENTVVRQTVKLPHQRQHSKTMWKAHADLYNSNKILTVLI